MAGEVRLFENPEFEQAMLRAAEHFGVSEQFVEKDYYVTEILRIIAERLGDKAMFKGGTSLSKGWGLISRFSEDIDLFVNPDRFDRRPGKKKMDRILKELAAAVGEHPALTWQCDESVTIGGLGREDYFAYETRFAGLPGIRPAVRLEPGVQSGTFPTEVVAIASLVAQFLQEQGSSDMADDLEGFEMTSSTTAGHLWRRCSPSTGRSCACSRMAWRWVATPATTRTSGALRDSMRSAMLASPEYGEIRQDYDAKSRVVLRQELSPARGLVVRWQLRAVPRGLTSRSARCRVRTQCDLLFSTVTTLPSRTSWRASRNFAPSSDRPSRPRCSQP